MIDLDAIRSSTIAKEPFTYFATNRVLGTSDLTAVNRDFPAIVGTGIHPLHELTYGPHFAHLVDDLRSPQFEQAIAASLGVELVGHPLMITVRGHCHKRDGRIHTDSKDKIATVLLYLNEHWQAGANSPAGHLRLLRSGNDLEDVIVEIAPRGGTLVAFRRSDNSWHGHHAYEGPRRYVMCNWLVSRAALASHVGRHTLSAKLKRLANLAGGNRWISKLQ